MVEINIVQEVSGVAKLQLINGIDFDYRNLTLGIPAQSFENSLNEVFNYIGSCEIVNETIGLGPHHIIEGKDDRHYLIKVESFEANFKPVTGVIVLGWGSLIWDPRELEVRGKWMPDGPFLPIEFARISSRERLTLVRKQDAKPVQVLWNVMTGDLNTAIENLRIREDCSTSKPIGFIDLQDKQSRSKDDGFMNRIVEWADSKGFKKVIWTDLGVNFKNRNQPPFNHDTALKYLRSLEDQTSAREYIEKAPAQIKTDLRIKVRKELGWSNKEIS